LITITKDQYMVPGFYVLPLQLFKLLCLAGFRVKDADIPVISKYYQCRFGIP